MLFFFPLTVCRSLWSIFVLKQKLLLIPKNYAHIYLCIMQMGVAEGWIYVLVEKPAGSSFRVFDPQANKWSMLPPIAGHSLQENWQGFACVAVGHKLILMGGRYVDTTTSMHHSSGSNLPQVLRVTSTIIHTWALVVISQMSPLMGGWGPGIVVSSIQHWIYITLEHLTLHWFLAA